MRSTFFPSMRPTFAAFNAAKKVPKKAHPELYPLIFCCFVVCCSATFFVTKHLREDDLSRKLPRRSERLSEVVSKEAPSASTEAPAASTTESSN